jgi:glycosyltransferase involved in cell wall biosynthesis
MSDLNHKTPAVSIGMPVFNGERYVSQAIDSLLKQEYRNFELIISDNGSTDKTEELCRNHQMRDNRIRYYRNDHNKGPAWNFNRVFELSSNTYFMWACHDDYWDSLYLSSCLKEFANSESLVLVGSACKSVNAETETEMLVDKGISTIGLRPYERYKKYKLNLHSGSNIGGIFCGIFKRDVLCKIMPPKNRLTSDHLVLAELSLRGEFFTVGKTLMVKRWGGASKSIESIANTLGITNRFVIMFPYLEREFLLQKIIFQSDKLTLTEKFRLSRWSLWHYVQLEMKLKKELVAPLFYSTFKIIPLWIKRPAKRILKFRQKSVNPSYNIEDDVR